MKKISFLSFLLLTAFSLSAEIMTSKSIKDVLTYTDKDTLVIFDIDNTIARENNDTGWGGDQWLEAHVKNFIEHGLSVQKAWDLALPIYFESQHSKGFGMVPVEPVTLDVFKEVQKKADKVIALTARSYPLVQLTIKFLKDIDINFLDNGFEEEFIFDKVPGKYVHGMFFCGPGDKGESLLALLSRIDYRPKKVVFIDDKMKNLHSVERAIEALDIEFLGIHYIYLEDKVKNFKLSDILPLETRLTPVVVL